MIIKPINIYSTDEKVDILDIFIKVKTRRRKKQTWLIIYFCSIDFFKKVGEVVRVQLIVNLKGKLVGCGFVEFASVNEAEEVRVFYSNDEKLYE